MASKTEIWNLGLNHIGQSFIESPTEGSVQSIALDKVWSFVLQEVLRNYRWGFSTVRGALALVANYTPLEFTYAYAYPSKALKIWKVTYDGAGEDTPGEKYKKLYDPANNQLVLVTNLADAYVEYAYDVTDTTKFDPSFVVALAHRLAAEVAFPLNGDKDMAKEQIVLFNGLVSEGKRDDDGERKVGHPQNEQSGFIDARS